MKKIVIVIVASLLLFTVVISAAQVGNFTGEFFRELLNSNSGGVNGSVNKPTENVDVCTTFAMNRLKHTYDYAALLESESCGVLFTATIPQSMKVEAESANATLKMVYGPLSAFEQAAASEGFEGDWIAAFENASSTVVITTIDENHTETLSNKGVLLRVWSENDLDETAATKMTAIAYVEHEDGTRVYAEFPEGETYASLAHSYLYVAIQKGQYNTSLSEVVFKAAGDAYAKALELAYNGTRESFDLSTVIDATPLIMKIGDTKQFPCSVEINGVELPIKWFWKATQQSVVKDGLFEMKEAQDGYLQGMLWGEYVTIDVTCDS